MTGWEYGFFIGLLKLATKMAVAIGMLFGGLTVFNKLNGVSFTDVLERISKDPRAESIYYSRRTIALALTILGVLIGSLN